MARRVQAKAISVDFHDSSDDEALLFEDVDDTDSEDEIIIPRKPAAPAHSHPIPLLQRAFEESIADSAEQIRTGKPPLQFSDLSAEERRERLLSGEEHNDTYNAMWKEDPTSKFHPLTKIIAQIAYGVHLLHTHMAKSNDEVIRILQRHIDEVDEFIRRADEDLGMALSDIEGRISHLKFALEDRTTFDVMLEDRKYRLEILTGNDLIEELIKRTANLTTDMLADIRSGLEGIQHMTAYMARIGATWPNTTDKGLYNTMLLNTEGWLECFQSLKFEGDTLGSCLMELGTLVSEMAVRAGAASRKAALSNKATSPSNSDSPSHSDDTIRAAYPPRQSSNHTESKPLPQGPDDILRALQDNASTVPKTRPNPALAYAKSFSSQKSGRSEDGAWKRRTNISEKRATAITDKRASTATIASLFVGTADDAPAVPELPKGSKTKKSKIPKLPKLTRPRRISLGEKFSFTGRARAGSSARGAKPSDQPIEEDEVTITAEKLGFIGRARAGSSARNAKTAEKAIEEEKATAVTTRILPGRAKAESSARNAKTTERVIEEDVAHTSKIPQPTSNVRSMLDPLPASKSSPATSPTAVVALPSAPLSSPPPPPISSPTLASPVLASPTLSAASPISQASPTSPPTSIERSVPSPYQPSLNESTLGLQSPPAFSDSMSYTPKHSPAPSMVIRRKPVPGSIQAIPSPAPGNSPGHTPNPSGIQRRSEEMKGAVDARSQATADSSKSPVPDFSRSLVAEPSRSPIPGSSRLPATADSSHQSQTSKSSSSDPTVALPLSPPSTTSRPTSHSSQSSNAHPLDRPILVNHSRSDSPVISLERPRIIEVVRTSPIESADTDEESPVIKETDVLEDLSSSSESSSDAGSPFMHPFRSASPKASTPKASIETTRESILDGLGINLPTINEPVKTESHASPMELRSETPANIPLPRTETPSMISTRTSSPVPSTFKSDATGLLRESNTDSLSSNSLLVQSKNSSPHHSVTIRTEIPRLAHSPRAQSPQPQEIESVETPVRIGSERYSGRVLASSPAPSILNKALPALPPAMDDSDSDSDESFISAPRATSPKPDSMLSILSPTRSHPVGRDSLPFQFPSTAMREREGFSRPSTSSIRSPPPQSIDTNAAEKRAASPLGPSSAFSTTSGFPPSIRDLMDQARPSTSGSMKPPSRNKLALFPTSSPSLIDLRSRSAMALPLRERSMTEIGVGEEADSALPDPPAQPPRLVPRTRDGGKSTVAPKIGVGLKLKKLMGFGRRGQKPMNVS
ncbi:hypothetical protein BT63DRAFT_313655 [Microthyrium microscopicum]|uniref:Uncharacterized protein n=1 Tax=Microthyrium microscopicum TaxID=703497 RepID=A0A6A6U2X1_9PEZI|nr:hypothetical protein BT63DRAFT_313655 [Microthyrium microscopicum]